MKYKRKIITINKMTVHQIPTIPSIGDEVTKHLKQIMDYLYKTNANIESQYRIYIPNILDIGNEQGVTLLAYSNTNIILRSNTLNSPITTSYSNIQSPLYIVLFHGSHSTSMIGKLKGGEMIESVNIYTIANNKEGNKNMSKSFFNCHIDAMGSSQIGPLEVVCFALSYEYFQIDITLDTDGHIYQSFGINEPQP